jgi:hypothetical protein
VGRVTGSPLWSPRSPDLSHMEKFQRPHYIHNLHNLVSLALTLYWRFLNKNFKYPQFQSFAAMLLRSALFWGITQRRIVILYRRVGTKYRSHLQWSRSPGPFLLGLLSIITFLDLPQLLSIVLYVGILKEMTFYVERPRCT